MTSVADIFMQIEYPQNGPLEIHSGRRYPTIGAFYQAILRAFECHPGWIVDHRQIEYQNGPVDIFLIAKIDDVRRAVSSITEHGEGTSSDPFAPSGDTAHYYRFGEIYHQHEIQSDGNGGWRYSGGPVFFPAVFPVPEVPPTGDGTPASHDFNRVYTSMLNDLQTAWDTGDTTKLESSLDKLKEMKPLARGMMQTPLPEGGGNYCPDFRLNP